MNLAASGDQSKTRILGFLNNLPAFKEFTMEEKEELANLDNSIIIYPANTKIVEQGEVGLAVYIILRGEVIVTKNESPNSVINTLETEAIFGEVSLLSNKPRSTNIISKGSVKVLRLNGELFEKLKPSTRKKLKDQFIAVIVNRLEHMNHSLVKIKVELDGLCHATKGLQAEFDKIIKTGCSLKTTSKDFNKMISNLIR